MQLTVMRIEDCVDKPFRVLRVSMTGVLQLGRTVFIRKNDGRVLKHGYIEQSEEGPGAAIEDSSMGAPQPGSLVVPVSDHD